MPVFDVDGFISSLKTKYNIADEDLKQVSEIKSGFLRQDEFSRKQQALDAERARVTALEQQNVAKYQDLLAYEESVQALEAQYGPREMWPTAFAARVGAGNPTGQGMQPAMTPTDIARIVSAEVSKVRDELTAQFKQDLELTGQGAAAFSKFYYNANKRWESEYGSPLPEDDFQTFYRENGHTNPVVALQLFEAPFKEKKREDEWERKAKEREAAAELRGRSQANIPETSQSSAGSWFGSDAVSAGANATAAGGANVDEMTREQKVALFNQNLEKQKSAGALRP